MRRPSLLAVVIGLGAGVGIALAALGVYGFVELKASKAREHARLVETQNAYCKIKLYILLTNSVGTHLAKALPLAPSKVETEAVKHALRLVASIPSGPQCVPSIRATLQHDGIRLNGATERLLLRSATATTRPVVRRGATPRRPAQASPRSLPIPRPTRTVTTRTPAPPPAPGSTSTVTTPSPSPTVPLVAPPPTAPTPPPVLPPVEPPRVTVPLPCVRTSIVTVC